MSQLIVDVSEHNGDIDWQQVKDAGYHAIIRVGFGRFDSGGRLDNKFEQNASECERLGIPYGFYWYSYATRTESAQIEAQQMVEAVAPYNPAYPLYFDSEEPGTESVAKANAEAFGDVIEAAGYWCGVYASQSWWQSNLQGLERFTKWVARWSDYEPTVADTDLWQNRGADADDYSLRGSVPGIGWSDLNVLLREDLLAEIGRWDKSEDETPETETCPTCGQPIPPADDGSGDEEVEAPDQVIEEGSNVLTYQQRAAEVMVHLCTHDGNGGHGYSQYARWGDGTYETLTLSDGTQVVVPNGDFDCSSACITAWEAVLPGCTGDATYTGNMIEGFTSTGLFAYEPWENDYQLQVGDLTLNIANHVAMCVGSDFTLAQFSISELNTIYGAQGDQTGWESNIKPFFTYAHGGWDGIIHYIGEQPTGTSTPDVEIPPTSGTTLDVDGWWGSDTTTALQNRFGTYVDGEIWHQWPSNSQAAFTTGWCYDYTQSGSPVIRALQAYLGVTTDGLIGTNTICALQEKMGTYVDGVLDGPSNCVKEMQSRLAAGTF